MTLSGLVKMLIAWYTLPLLSEDQMAENERLGRCYEFAAKHILWVREYSDTAGIYLVHGRIENPDPNSTGYAKIDHAWIECGEDRRTAIVYDAVLNAYFRAWTWYQKYRATVQARYNVCQALARMLSSKNYGPWHKDTLK